MNWHKIHEESRNFGQKLADSVAAGMGSWRFIIIQSIIVIIWMSLNVVSWCYHWDIYPFILLNLLFSTQAAYAAPIIMMAQNRAAERDRHNAEADYQVNLNNKKEIEHIIIRLNAIELDKLNKLIEIMDKLNEHNHEHLHNITKELKEIKENLNKI
jgi:uncharacterized membrane protein